MTSYETTLAPAYYAQREMEQNLVESRKFVGIFLLLFLSKLLRFCSDVCLAIIYGVTDLVRSQTMFLLIVSIVNCIVRNS